MRINQNKSMIDLNDLESLFDWSKGFQDWLQMGISKESFAFTFVVPGP